MKLWIWLTLALLLQETFGTNAALSEAIASHKSLWIIHLIFFLTTSVDILIGYLVGKGVQKLATLSAKVGSLSVRFQDWTQRVLGRRTERYGLFALGTVAQPWLTSFAGSWFKISFAEVFFVSFTADIIWYCFSLAVVLGVHAILPARYVLVGVIIATATLMILIRVVRKRAR